MYAVRTRNVNALLVSLVAALLLGGNVASAQVLPPLPTPSPSPPPAPNTPTRVVVEPPLFSPNGDGTLDSAVIRVEVERPASVRIEVLAPGDRVVRSWTHAASPNAPARIDWDGRGDQGALPDGAYTVRARPASAEDRIQPATATATLDTRAPRLVSVAAAPRNLTTQEEISIRFRAEDPSIPLRAHVEISDLAERVATINASVDGQEGVVPWRPRTESGRPLPNGTYAASVEVRDAAGNTSVTRTRAWRVQRPMPGRVLRRVEGAGPRVAITIDDCHYAGAWADMLETLREHEAHATFFCPGRQILANPALVRRTVKEGHEVAAHAWDHALLTAAGYQGTFRRLEQDANALWKVGGRTTAPYMRPPYGAYNSQVVAAAGRSGHPYVVIWDVDTHDWQRPGTSTIVSTAVRNANRGSIILLHTLPQTAAGLSAIIQGLRQQGLEPGSLSELLAA